MSIDFNFNPLISYLNNIRDFGLEYVARRYYGLYGGRVTDYNSRDANQPDADPRSQARVRVKVGVFGVGTVTPGGSFDPIPLSRPALPTSIYAGLDHGLYFPPEINDWVWVSFNHGDPNHPRTHGSWWVNSDPNGDPSKSEVPAEFRLDHNGATVKGHPKRRGIKTKFGHGMVFSDDESAPYVALWSGKQTAKHEKAVVNQQITLSDTTGVKTAKDQTVDAGIYANTIEGLRLALNDTKKEVLLSGNPDDPEGVISNSLKIEETTNKITIKTKGPEGARHEIVLDDTTQTVSIKTKGQQSIIINDAAATMSITATGAVTIAAAGGIAMGSGGPPPPAAPGVAVESGQGAKIINFAGSVTETVGAFTQNVGAAIINATSFFLNTPIFSLGSPVLGISFLGGFITIGNQIPGIAQQACNAQLIQWLKEHRHTGNLGAPTTLFPADLATLMDPLNPALPNPLYVTDTKIS